MVCLVLAYLDNEDQPCRIIAYISLSSVRILCRFQHRNVHGGVKTNRVWSSNRNKHRDVKAIALGLDDADIYYIYINSYKYIEKTTIYMYFTDFVIFIWSATSMDDIHIERGHKT
jgi:hypothetical protein